MMCCAQVWDVMEDQEAIDFVLDRMRDFDRDPTNSLDKEKLNYKLEDVARALVQLALDKKSLDNITVMVIKL